MELGLAGRAVVVTGASRGIGRAIALGFAREGASLAICARGAADLAATAQEIAALGCKTHARACDVADPAALDDFLCGAHAAFGRLDVLVNSASALALADDPASWEASFRVDLLPAVRASQRVLPWLVQSGGSIVHVVSTAALEGPGPPAYSALKAALLSHAKNLALAQARSGVRVNCVAPGPIEFPGGLWERVRREQPDRYSAMKASIPAGRLGRPEEVADAVVFLCSAAARWITGATLCIDGGQRRGVF